MKKMGTYSVFRKENEAFKVKYIMKNLWQGFGESLEGMGVSGFLPLLNHIQ